MTSQTVLERFWSKVTLTDGCWEWTANKSSRGYGYFWMPGNKGILAHRFSYEQVNGPIPDGLVIDHLCRNTSCVNPKHLEAVTQRENLLRGVGASARNAQKLHCSNGHEFTADNTKRLSSGRRSCRECARERKRKHAHKYAAQIAEYQRTYREANKDRLREYDRARKSAKEIAS